MDQSNANDVSSARSSEIRAHGNRASRVRRNETIGAHPLDQPTLDVGALRKRMQITQRQFAGWFGLPVATLRHWERGNRRPSGTALVLLYVIRENPRVVLQAVRKVRLRAPGILAPIEPKKSLRASPGFGDRSPPLRRRGKRRR